MIITKIVGGLGNQMFQYAAARALSLRLGQPLLLDISAFNHYSLHNGFELARIFNCINKQASASEIREVLGWQGGDFFREVLARNCLRMFRKSSLVIEPHFEYWPNIRYLPGNCYMSGYWQSERYFFDESRQIHEDFDFKEDASPDNQKLIDRMLKSNSVSLHIRRGDYISSLANSKIYAACSADYYRKAIDYISSRILNPEFYVFSDDVAWVKRNLHFECSHEFVSHNSGACSYNDMRLMSFCQHNIIANSSFSWWGAWLNSNHEKIVIAPHSWFINGTNTDDLYPQGWVKL